MATGEELLSVKEVSTICKVDPQTVYNWIRVKKIPSVKIGDRIVRIRAADLNHYIKTKA